MLGQLTIGATAFFAFVGVSSTTVAAAPDPAEWVAHWVWGTKHFNRGDGYFRLTFTVDGDVERAVSQGSGDDSYELYVNGTLVRQSFFAFSRTDRTDFAPHLRPGTNVVAAVCHNAAPPGGWLEQLLIVYADGREQFVVSDDRTRFRHEKQEG